MGVSPQSSIPAVTMHRVAANMTETYYGDETRKTNLEAPRVTVNNHRMTNVQLPGGTVVQGIRRNNDLGHENLPPQPYEPENPLKPLRYTPGLKCDPALEALRPERSMKHPALQGGDQWKKKLIQHPHTYEGSFANADMQKFRPDPIPNPMEDPWVMSRLPDQPVGASMPYDGYGVPGEAQDEEQEIPAVLCCRTRNLWSTNATSAAASPAMDSSGTHPRTSSHDDRGYDAGWTPHV